MRMPVLFMMALLTLSTVVQGGGDLFSGEWEEHEIEAPKPFSSLHFQNFAMDDDVALEMMVRVFIYAFLSTA